MSDKPRVPIPVDFEATRRKIQIGIDQADRGECTPLDIEAIKQKARATWNERQESARRV